MSQLMSNSLWGISLKPNEVYSFKGSGLLQLQQCNLNTQPCTGKTQLEVHAKGHTYTLCTLIPSNIECQLLSHVFIAEDQATLKVKGVNEIHVMGTLTEYDLSEEEEEEELIRQIQNGDGQEEEEEEEETATGYPTMPTYLSDLLGPDLPDEDDEDEEGDGYYMDQDVNDAYGAFSFRDVNDNSLLGGFELRHFNLVPNYPGYEEVDLRKQEKSMEESLLNDSIATGLINALLNSGDKSQMEQGLALKKKLNHYCKQRGKKEETGEENKKLLTSTDDKSKKKMKHKKSNKSKLKKTLKMLKKKEINM